MITQEEIRRELYTRTDPFHSSGDIMLLHQLTFGVSRVVDVHILNTKGNVDALDAFKDQSARQIQEILYGDIRREIPSIVINLMRIDTHSDERSWAIEQLEDLSRKLS